jgi:hypothetical protein
MKSWDKVSSLRGAHTLLQGQQDENRNTEERSQKADQQADISSRPKEGPTQIREDGIKGDQRTRAEEPGPLRDITSEGQSTL